MRSVNSCTVIKLNKRHSLSAHYQVDLVLGTRGAIQNTKTSSLREGVQKLQGHMNSTRRANQGHEENTIGPDVVLKRLSSCP